MVFRYTNHDQPLWIGDEEFKPSRPISAQDPLNPDGSVTIEGVSAAELAPGGAQPDWILVL